MEKVKNIKIFVGLFYLMAVCLFLYFFFSKYSFQEITSYEFIKNNRDYFFEIKKSKPILFMGLFFLFCIIWTLASGFASPLVLFAGFVFGNFLGTFILVTGLTIGATGVYIFANYFFKDFIKKKFLSKFINLEKKFKKSELLFLLIYRFVGGIPFALSNVLPCMFNVKISNFFLATLIGLTPQMFVLTSIASAIEKIVDQNLEAPRAIDVIASPSIYIPISIFFGLIIFTIIFRKFFYKN